jgi:glutamate-ammonia-ligase adenylyltransferase
MSDLADLVLQRTLVLVEDEFALKHGRIKGARAALLGMGKLGSRELTAGSDIDLVLLYEHPDDAEESDGDKPLYPSHYYARLTQRLIAAVSAPTGEGVLYELDLRLRPSGNKGPVATRLSAFRKYQHEEAWTWEHMALTRARVVAADEGLASTIEHIISEVLNGPHDRAKVDADVAEMRTLIEQEKPSKGIWDFKLMPGGLIDLEFIAQAAAMSGRAGGIVSTRTEEILQNVAMDGLTSEDREILSHAHRLFSSLTQILRLCLEDEAREESVSAAQPNCRMAIR